MYCLLCICIGKAIEYQLTSITLNGGISLVSFQTDAHHCAHWHCIEDLALGIDTARLGSIARIHTFAADASRLRWTITIVATMFVVLTTIAVNIGHESRWTGAFWSMIVHMAYFINFAGGGVGAWIFATGIDASLIARTVRVAAAADNRTGFSGITAQSGWTFANSTMIDAEALGAFATRATVHRAHRCTLSIDAGMCARAFVIRSAADAHTLYFRIAVVALLTRAHGFVIFDTTIGVRAAIAWITTDVIDARPVTWTIRIGYAAANFDDRFQWFARSASAADVTLGTDTNHCAYR